MLGNCIKMGIHVNDDMGAKRKGGGKQTNIGLICETVQVIEKITKSFGKRTS